MTAQTVREKLNKAKYIPLVKIGMSEHWVKGSHRCVLVYEGDYPGKVEAQKLLYARIEKGRVIPCLAQ